MTHRLFAMSLGFALCALALQANAAGTNCASRDQLVQRLTVKYGETRRSIGLVRDSGFLEIFASAATGSWSILLTHADGQTCLIAAGTQYHNLKANSLNPADGA